NIPLRTFKKIITDLKLTEKEIKNYIKSIMKVDLWHISEEIKPVWILTTEIAEFLGYFIAERTRRIGISTDTMIAIDRFKEIVENNFGLELKEDKKNFEVYSDKYATLEEFLIKCFDIVKINESRRASKAKVPKILFNSTKQEIASFLRAFFSVESSIHINKGCIEVVSASESLIKDIGFLLLMFGIIPILSSKIIKNRKYYGLYIYGYKNRKIFHDEIGFIDPLKSEKLRYSLSKRGPRAIELIPAGDLLILINKISRFGFDNYSLKKNDYSTERLTEILNSIECDVIQNKNRITAIAYKILKFMNSEFIFWDEVKDKTLVYGDFEVYDFEVENTHNFLAGNLPIVVHNSTFATSIAEFYIKEKNVILKTLESPKDLQVPDEVTQYGPLNGDFAKTADILLLVRPDYTIFDEVRLEKHFRVFADMRLSGIGMIGVVHASEAIDAIQRFIGKIELGMIPHVIDTVIFLKDGEIKNVYYLQLTVKVPTGMTEADLARPIVEVRDFETGKLIYEIYSYGEENVVIPIKEEKASAIEDLARKTILHEIKKYDPHAEIAFTSPERVTVRVDNNYISRLIGKDGKNISEIEDRLGIHIDVEPKVMSSGKEIDHRLFESGNSLIISFEKSIRGKSVSIYIESDFILSATVGKKNEIKISKSSEIGRELMKAIVNKKKIKVLSN
ncbi:MAG: LAGLIDADG family homing endonuclease, partial [Fervidobacterium sp.]